jgi:hypothetical protein
MKKIVLCLMATVLSLTFVPLQLSAATEKNPTSVVVPKPEESAEAKVLENRLNEIKALDKSTMKAEEKKAVRKEVKSIKRELRELGGGVYLSAAAVILIVILLIVLL